MEGTKVHKGAQGNNHRFVRNRRDDNSFNHPIHEENSVSSQGGKVNSVKPRYSSVDHTKHVEMKPGIDVLKQDDGNKQESKGNFKGKDGHFHRGKDGHYHGQKENRTNIKHDDRRKFNFPKEKSNTRHPKSYSRNQSKGNEVHDEARTRKQPSKNESVVSKRNDNTNMSSTPQHLKPAVHVQPLQQVSEKTGVRPTVAQNSSTLQTTDSSVRTSNQASAEGCQDVSSVGYAKEMSYQISTSQQILPKQAASTMVHTIPGKVEATQTTDRTKQNFQAPDLLHQIPLNQINPVFPTEARSLADINSSGLGSYLSSSICSSFLPQKDLLKPQSNPPANQTMLQDSCLLPAQLAQGQPNNIPPKFLTEQNLLPLHDRSQDSQSCAMHDVKQPLVGHSQNSFQMPHDQLEEAVSLQSMPDEKYGYRISVDSLFSTSFFTNTQTGVKHNTDDMVETRDSLHENHMVKNQKCQETTVFPNQVFQRKETQQIHVKRDQRLNEAQQYDVMNPNNMKTNNTSLNMVKNPKCNEKLILSSQLPHDQLLNEAQNLDVENSSNTKNNPTTVNNHLLKNQQCNETTVLSNQIPHDQLLNEPQHFDAGNPNKIKTTNPSLLDYQSLAPSQDTYKKDENFDARLVSPKRSKGVDKQTLGSPPPVLRNLAPHVGLQGECTLMKKPSFSLESTNTRTYRNLTDQPEDERLPTGKMSGFSREDKSTRSDMTSEKEIVVNNIPQLNCAQGLQEPMAKPSLTNTNSDVQTNSLVNPNYREIPKLSTSLHTDGFPVSETKETLSARCLTTSDKTSQLTKVELQPTSPGKGGYEKNDPPLLDGDVENNQVHRGVFPHGPFLPNPFLSHSLLTHRQAIPSAFVYPSRVGIPGSHSGFTDVAQHTGNNPGSHIFPPHGTTVCLNVGGRIFEILPSTFAPYPESLLCQIFTGAAPAPISQRGHIFFDRDGYLFEIILAFARVGHFTFPPNVNLTSLMNEAKFFGMYKYMFQKGQVSSRNMLQFQRTTRCTLHCDDSRKTSDTKVFVLQGDDKLKIESLRVSGPCHLYVDLYTPSGYCIWSVFSSNKAAMSYPKGMIAAHQYDFTFRIKKEEGIEGSYFFKGVKETSNFVIYTSDKPDLWKAYQFCAERQLVFHLEHAHADTTVKGCNKSSVDIVFAQTFVFAGDEFVFNL